MHEYDKSGKWLIQHHGNSILRLAGILDIDSWKPLQAEIVQSRRLPDGLVEVQFHRQPDPDLFVVEIATYPEARVAEQVVRDTALVYNVPKLFQILGGRKAMIESPLLQELIAERTRDTMIEDLMTVLVARFGSKARAVETEIKAIGDEARLKDLIKQAVTARTLSSFRKQLAP